MAVSGGRVRITGIREVVRDLQRLGVDVQDIKDAFASIAAEGAHLAAGFAPKRTGAMAASIRGNRAKSKAVITGGRGKTNQYIGVINYGFPRRNIAASGFMQDANKALSPHVVVKLETAIDRLLRERGMT